MEDMTSYLIYSSGALLDHGVSQQIVDDLKTHNLCIGTTQHQTKALLKTSAGYEALVTKFTPKTNSALKACLTAVAVTAIAKVKKGSISEDAEVEYLGVLPATVMLEVPTSTVMTADEVLADLLEEPKKKKTSKKMVFSYPVEVEDAPKLSDLLPVGSPPVEDALVKKPMPQKLVKKSAPVAVTAEVETMIQIMEGTVTFMAGATSATKNSLSTATDIGQKVHGTSSGSTYRVFYLSDQCKLAFRYKDNQISIRAEKVTSLAVPVLNRFHFSKNGDYHYSMHTTVEKDLVPVTLFAIAWAFKRPGSCMATEKEIMSWC